MPRRWASSSGRCTSGPRVLATPDKGFGFEGCSWTTGWGTSKFFCYAGNWELDITLVSEPRFLRHMLPSSKCFVASRTQASAAAPWRGGGALELPCPARPLEFTREVWSDMPKLTDCFALPSSFDDGGMPRALTAADVRYIWESARKLHLDGFASMAPYFTQCRGHPLAAAAVSAALGDSWAELF
mmetsp:Transcript_43975/g.127996  ORF Transcript_43975/g.127996 Transcript_43975/m.127996 type:complete len:185 (-) Transcript_43975:143-697(-)